MFFIFFSFSKKLLKVLYAKRNEILSQNIKKTSNHKIYFMSNNYKYFITIKYLRLKLLLLAKFDT